MEARAAVPSEAWGTDPDRYILANKIAAIIRDEIEWPNANFIPEDPMCLVLFRLDTEDLFWDNMEIECIFIEIEYALGCSFTFEEVDTIYAGTFGEAVDLLLEIRRNRSEKEKSLPR